MTNSNSLLSIDPDTLSLDEEKLRRKLIGGTPRAASSQQPASNRARHRFKQDGEIPVVVLNPQRSFSAGSEMPIAKLEAALRSEREAREQLGLLLEQARATIRSMQTQIAHTELAHREALSSEQEARERAEAAARDALSKVVVHSPISKSEVSDTPPERKRKVSGARVRSRTENDEPVAWWLPDWRKNRH